MRGLQALLLVSLGLFVGCSAPAPAPAPAAPELPRQVDPAEVEGSAPPAWLQRALWENAGSQWSGLSSPARSAWLEAALHRGALSPPLVDEESRVFVAALGPGATQQAGREQVVAQVTETVLADLSYSILAPQHRERLRTQLVGVLREERFEASSGRYSARVSVSEARAQVLNLLEADAVLGAEEFVLGLEPGEWFNGASLSGAERALLPRAIGSACSDELLRYRLRKAPKSSDRERVERAALELGVSPSTQRLRSFAESFQAQWVITLRGQIRYEPFTRGTPSAAEHYGYLRCEGVSVKVYRRGSDAIVAEFSLASEPALRQPDPTNARRIHQPWIPKDARVSEAVETYARSLGRSIALNVIRRLYQHFYARR